MDLHHRQGEHTLCLVNEQGDPIPQAETRITLQKHEFRFGCNGFLLHGEGDLFDQYRESFQQLLNYATLPFYWGGYEPEVDATKSSELQHMAQWCTAHHISVKGHPLAWHEVFPRWAESMGDEEVLDRLKARIKQLVVEFHPWVQSWDGINEATVSHRFDNAVGRWVQQKGAAHCVDTVLRWAKEANPSIEILYNDFNVSSDMETLLTQLVERDTPLDAIGIQSHMHTGTWDLERAWQVCETYAAFQRPLHFTELTVLSGRLKDKDDKDWHKRHTDWDSTPDGEDQQAEYGTALYKLLFSHPSTAAITWWDFSDHASWQGAPSGLLRKDMSPKPLYHSLYDLIHNQWHTDLQLVTDEDGQVRYRGFYGDYQITTSLASGHQFTGTYSLRRDSDAQSTVVLS